MRKHFIVDAIQSQNKLRMLHGATDLELDAEMSKRADEWAYILAKKGSLEHEEGIEDGENLFLSCSDDSIPIKARDVISSW